MVKWGMVSMWGGWHCSDLSEHRVNWKDDRSWFHGFFVLFSLYQIDWIQHLFPDGKSYLSLHEMRLCLTLRTAECNTSKPCWSIFCAGIEILIKTTTFLYFVLYWLTKGTLLSGLRPLSIHTETKSLRAAHSAPLPMCEVKVTSDSQWSILEGIGPVWL